MTVLVALAKDETARRINQVIPPIERPNAVVLLLAGCHMLYYAQTQTL